MALFTTRLALLTAVSITALAGTAHAETLTGRVAGADDRALPGAIIEIPQTGQSVETDSSGAFQIDLEPGEYQLEVYFLGYADAVQKVTVVPNDITDVDITLAQRGATEASEIVVRGAALGLSLAANEQRTADNISNVVSADALGRFPDNNLAESVSRLPGVTLVRDQQTGEGAFVTIRGLDSRLNVYTLNGVRVATSGGGNRGINLAQLPSDGLSSVKVSKSLLPDMDGDALGGTVDFRTPSAFDFGKTTVTLSGTYSWNDRAEEGNYDMAGSLATFIIPDRLGLFVSGYYERKNSIGQESENEGDWLPFRRPAGSQDLTVDPQEFQMQGLGLDLFENELERYGGNFTLDYKFDNGSKLYLRGQYSSFTDREDHHSVDVQNDDEVATLNQVDPSDDTLLQPWEVLTGFDPVLGNIYGYTPQQIIDADGDGIISDFDRREAAVDDDGFYTLGGESGIWSPGRVIFQRGFSFKEETQRLYSASTGGEHFLDDWTITWDASYSYGEFDRPFDYDFDFDDTGDQTGAPFTGVPAPRGSGDPLAGSGAGWSFAQPEYPQWQLTTAQQAAYFDPGTYLFGGSSGGTTQVTDENILGQINIRRDFSDTGPLKYVKFGGRYFRKEHTRNSDTIFDSDEQDLTLADAPGVIRSSTYGDFLSGNYAGNDDFGFTFDRDAIQQAIDSCDPLFFEECTGFEEELGDDASSTETIYAGYAMAAGQFGRLEVIGGVRVEHTEVRNDYFSFQEFQAELADGTEFGDIERIEQGADSSNYTNVLPSIGLNFRADRQLVVRAAVYKSIARPDYEDISSEEDVSADVIVDSNGNILSFVEDTLSVSRGNPNLKPAEAWNFDAGVEYYTSNGGLYSVNVFYKDISNFIFSDFANEGAVLGEFGGETVEFGAISNGNDAQVYGIEVALVQQLRTLPSPFDGLGIAANATFQDSTADPGDDWRPDTVFINAPRSQYNLQLFYEKYGFDGRIAYQYTDRYLEDLRNFGVNKWVNSWDRLDAQVRYTFDFGLTLRVEVQNILDGHNYWAIRGENGDAFQKDYVENGRTFYLGADIRF
jgi:iron complex outermembrane recepter protein